MWDTAVKLFAATTLLAFFCSAQLNSFVPNNPTLSSQFFKRNRDPLPRAGHVPPAHSLCTVVAHILILQQPCAAFPEKLLAHSFPWISMRSPLPLLPPLPLSLLRISELVTSCTPLTGLNLETGLTSIRQVFAAAALVCVVCTCVCVYVACVSVLELKKQCRCHDVHTDV